MPLTALTPLIKERGVMRQATIIVVAATTNQLLFISGFSVFSGFSGPSISNPSPKFLKNQSGSSGTVGNLTIAGPLMHAEAADNNNVVD